MGSLSRAAIAACIVLGGLSTHSPASDNIDGFSLQTTRSSVVDTQVKKKHPSSRETVAGHWPRFAKKMLA